MSLPAVAAGGPLFTIDRFASCAMLVVMLELLLAVFVSKVLVLTSAVFVTDVVLPAVIVSVNDADWPPARSPMAHVMVPDVSHDAAGPVFCTSELKVVLGGSASAHVTSTAVFDEMFEIVIV